ncbi:uncharacterized protein K444DRAFT_629230 [Hyaloscypha bicolor E]|uniref:Uncharacterized protein n=1 Tax=Hyaloscypha bicolor E TaxID=1095630 RepID=A0A2J6TCK2_9HELO|nr:uncharacterized protein K444DRAFT_629230 [Hyaloscypha bicolor E]PMD60749.1 hypothetical protein K444DRAFT_629230 [Hyaloscypha bicolor E]
MPNSVTEEHWRTLIANKLHTMTAGISNRVDDSHMMKEFLYFRTAQSGAKAGIGDNVDMACVGRPYFSTRNSRVSIGPADITAGDLVCAFFWANSMYHSPVPIGLWWGRKSLEER